VVTSTDRRPLLSNVQQNRYAAQKEKSGKRLLARIGDCRSVQRLLGKYGKVLSWYACLFHLDRYFTWLREVKITTDAGRPAWSDSYFSIKGVKSGPKKRTFSKFDASQAVGDPETRRCIVSTHREFYPKKHGGVGVWTLTIALHSSKMTGVVKSLKYAFVVAVESMSAGTVYADISKWLDERRKIALAEQVFKEREQVVPAKPQEQQMKLARV
jgi:hypothetical protein